MTPEFCYVLAPPREALEDQLRTSRPELAPLAAAVLRRAFCILVADHEDPSECAHALCLTELTDGYALWVRWTDHEDGRWRHCWFEVRRNCPDAGPDGEPCVLYLDHAGLHSWTATRGPVTHHMTSFVNGLPDCPRDECDLFGGHDGDCR